MYFKVAFQFKRTLSFVSILPKRFSQPVFLSLTKANMQYQCTGRNHKPLGNFNTQSKSNGAFLQKVSRGTLKDALTRCELSTFGIVDLTHETIC